MHNNFILKNYSYAFSRSLYRVHYESNAHDFIVTRLSIAARSDRSDYLVGVCPSKHIRSHFGPSSRSGRTCLRTKSVFRLSHGAKERSLEQRYAIKFCVRLGKDATETYKIL